MINLKSGGYKAKINPIRGANCISLTNEEWGAKILREPKSEKPDNPYLYGMPILFPANRISGGKFLFEGREYNFPINEEKTNCSLHGVLHELPFEVIELKSDFAKLKFASKYLDFPHEFSVEISYSLSEGGLTMVTKITNFSHENMPCFLGFHTTFNIPFVKGSAAENIRIYGESSSEIERDKNYLPTGKLLPFGEFERKINSGELMPFETCFSKHCPSAKGGKIEIRDLSKKVKIVYENDEKFGYRLFYNGNGDEYVCLEPMNCAVDAPNAPYDKDKMPRLFSFIPGGKSEEYVSRIYLEKI